MFTELLAHIKITSITRRDSDSFLCSSRYCKRLSIGVDIINIEIVVCETQTMFYIREMI